MASQNDDGQQFELFKIASLLLVEITNCYDVFLETEKF